MPTDVLARATTFDLYVANTAIKWENRQRDIAEGRVQPTVSKADELQRYMELAKKAHSERVIDKNKK